VRMTQSTMMAGGASAASGYASNKKVPCHPLPGPYMPSVTVRPHHADG
jgi:hypothetical protein